MGTFIVIGDDAYKTDTFEEIVEARSMLRLAGLESAPVYAGDPDDPESHKNGMILFATSALGTKRD